MPNVVVAFDFSELGAPVLARAVALVSRAPAHVLHFVTVLDPHSGIAAVPKDGPVDYRYADKVRDAVSDEVRRAFGAEPISDEIHFFIHTRIGKPQTEILGLAEEIGAELVLIGTHGRTGIKHLVMGSTAEHVVREAGCPVLVVRPQRYPAVQLSTMTKVEGPHPAHRSMQFSYHNSFVVMKPPDWTV